MRNWIIVFIACLISVVPIGTTGAGRPGQRHPHFMTAKKPTPDLVYQCARFYGLRHPETVTAQSILETDHYRSELCLRHRNLFGLYDFKRKRYRTFRTWQESVVAYKKLVQSKYRSGNYYAFLRRLPYADDPLYAEKVRRIQRRLKVTGKR